MCNTSRWTERKEKKRRGGGGEPDAHCGFYVVYKSYLTPPDSRLFENTKSNAGFVAVLVSTRLASSKNLS